MRYLIAIILPPLGMLLCGKIIQAVLCLIISIPVLLMTVGFGWPLFSIWGFMVVHSHNADKRSRRLEKAIDRQTAASRTP